MGKIICILGNSGDGKTTSTVINHDGKFDLKNYSGMDPATHFIINLDRKALPFPPDMWNRAKRNYSEPKDFKEVREILKWIALQENIKSVSIDTINIYLAMKEFNERKKMMFDQWRDISNDIIELNIMCNTVLRENQLVYIMGHTMLQTQPNGEEKIVFSVIGKKLTKVPPESFYPIVLMTRVEYEENGDNKYWFQTKACHSSAKTPIGMFSDFEIPNSLNLIDTTVRDFYHLNTENKKSDTHGNNDKI